MEIVGVKANVPLPGIPRGATAEVELTPRIEGLLASGRLERHGRRYRPELEVPRGTISEVMSWVGEDVDRAIRALDVELSSTAARSTLVKRLQTVALSDALYGVEFAPASDDSGEESSLATEHLSASGGL